MGRGDHGEFFQRGEGLVVVAVDAGAHAGSLRRTHGTVRIVQLDGGAGHAREGVAENGGEEHVGLAGVDHLHGDAHLFHDLDAVLEGEHDALLRRAHEMRLAVAVEVHPVDAAAGVLVAEHALRPVAEGKDSDSVRADGDLGGEGVHVGIGDALRGDVAADPGIQDAGAVDAQEHADAGIRGRMVHVRETVHAAQRVIVDGPVHAIDDAGSTGRGGDFSGFEHIEGQGVVGLVAGAVGDRCTGREPQQVRRFLRKGPLRAEGWLDDRDDAFVETEEVQQFPGRPILPEVPENALRQAAHGGAGRAGEAHGDIVAGEHDLADAPVHLRLVLLHPGEFRGGEVAGIVEQVVQAPVGPEGLEGLVAVRDGAGVAPDDGRAQDVPVLVHAHQAVHLVGDADGLDVGGGEGFALERGLAAHLFQDVGRGEFQVRPPHGGILLSEAGLPGHDGRFALGIEGGGDAFAGLDAYETGLDGRTSDVISE